VSSAFYSGLRNLISLNGSRINGQDVNQLNLPYSPPAQMWDQKNQINLPYFSPARVRTSNFSVQEILSAQLEHNRIADISRVGEFARSAHYMGSKRHLAPFLVEAVSSVLPRSGKIVDLMCGSGSAAAAFSRIWSTWASDGQSFSRLLAKVQGAGFSVLQAEALLERIVPCAQEHAEKLGENLKYFLDLEDEIFHGDIGPRLLEEYRRFHKLFPTYPNGRSRARWNPVREVQKRKENQKLVPYCLFTSYFANVYFGVRRSVEIDSLRFAIDQLSDDDEKDWAIGALIASLSALGTTYAAHFAQPWIKGPENLTLTNLTKVLEQRAYSVIHEFSIRLLNLAEESERAPCPIQIVNGPWPVALSTLEPILLPREQVLVYVDAPYRREEYSRYYHPLETLISYSYPSSLGSGRVPDKSLNERFESEFFTRSKSRSVLAYVDVIVSILKRGWMCGWSHSDSAAVSTVEVVEKVCESAACEVRSYAAPYTHRSQGGQRQKKVTEYLLVFLPKSE
jgi:adenine-specific DNA-methyltransferase